MGPHAKLAILLMSKDGSTHTAPSSSLVAGRGALALDRFVLHIRSASQFPFHIKAHD